MAPAQSSPSLTSSLLSYAPVPPPCWSQRIFPAHTSVPSPAHTSSVAPHYLRLSSFSSPAAQSPWAPVYAPCPPTTSLDTYHTPQTAPYDLSAKGAAPGSPSQTESSLVLWASPSPLSALCPRLTTRGGVSFVPLPSLGVLGSPISQSIVPGAQGERRPVATEGPWPTLPRSSDTASPGLDREECCCGLGEEPWATGSCR